ncbi:MAG: hypothetical protein KJ645_13390, partial [Planctomycetes bacterium]|nr:hypothetical protein [Planctomycetota bacterium]
DLSGLVNEVLAQPGWGSDQKAVILTMRDDSEPGKENYVTFWDDSYGKEGMKSPVTLEIYKTTYDTFLGKELVGRVTDRSATLSLYALIEMDLFVEYGASPGNYSRQTSIASHQPAGKGMEIVL